MAKRPDKLPIKPMAPGAPVLDTVPMSHERLLGRFVVEWAKLENTMDDLIWQFFDLPIEFGRVITSKMDANSKVQMLKTLCNTSFGHSSPDYMMTSYINELTSEISILRESRNLAVHGTWGRNHPSFTPMALSLRIKDNPSTVVAEDFPERRMRDMITDTIRLKLLLASLFEPARSAHRRSREQFHPLAQPHPPNQRDQTPQAPAPPR